MHFLLNDNTFKNNEEELKLCKERINSTIDHYDEYVNKIKPHLKKRMDYSAFIKNGISYFIGCCR